MTDNLRAAPSRRLDDDLDRGLYRLKWERGAQRTRAPKIKKSN